MTTKAFHPAQSAAVTPNRVAQPCPRHDREVGLPGGDNVTGTEDVHLNPFGAL
jgi:hypothetical protein